MLSRRENETVQNNYYKLVICSIFFFSRSRCCCACLLHMLRSTIVARNETQQKIHVENLFGHDKFKCWLVIFCPASPLESMIYIFLLRSFHLSAIERYMLSTHTFHTLQIACISRVKYYRTRNAKRSI